MTRFADLDTSRFRDSIVIVDIDGTITYDRSAELSPESLRVLRELTAHNRVYLCSNTKDVGRVASLASISGTFHLASPYRKPNRRVLEGVADREGKRVVVIGDKRLTDGLFAKRIGAEFVPVERLTHRSDRSHIALTYRLDDTYHVLSGYLRLMRPFQWVKNLLVFAPLFFAVTAFDPVTLQRAALAFVAFCAAASAVYVMNDIVDRERDAEHPVKRQRPVASGEVPVRGAWILCFALIAICGLVVWSVPQTAVIVGIYIALNIVYSTYLKHVAVADIVCVASFYVMRVLAGGLATGIYVSP